MFNKKQAIEYAVEYSWICFLVCVSLAVISMIIPGMPAASPWIIIVAGFIFSTFLLYVLVREAKGGIVVLNMEQEVRQAFEMPAIVMLATLIITALLAILPGVPKASPFIVFAFGSGFSLFVLRIGLKEAKRS